MSALPLGNNAYEAYGMPPWERRALVQVPFLDPSSRSVPDADCRGLLSPRANVSQARAGVENDRKGLASGAGQAPDGHDNPVVPFDRDLDQTFTLTYETPASTDATLKTSSPPRHPPLAPLTPPHSFSTSSSASSSDASAGHGTGARPVTAMGGTMSSRSRRHHRRRATSSHRNRSASTHSDGDSISLGKRFRSAVKDIFKRKPIEEEDFERIEDRHWTEEY